MVLENVYNKAWKILNGTVHSSICFKMSTVVGEDFGNQAAKLIQIVLFTSKSILKCSPWSEKILKIEWETPYMASISYQLDWKCPTWLENVF